MGDELLAAVFELTRLEEDRLVYELGCDRRSLRKEAAQPGSVRGRAGERIRIRLAALRAARRAAAVAIEPGIDHHSFAARG
jgi:hypothetical protein